MKMMDMGHKMESSRTSSVGMDKGMMYPSLNISHKIPEELKDKDVGDMCRLEIHGKVVSKSENDMGDSMTIEIRKMGYMGQAGKMSKEEYLSKPKNEREEYDRKEVMEH